MPDAFTSRKLFPRNLTAKADTLVRGNPVTTRPESGVENCYPGLEFDQRNLDKRFFPGLLFEYHDDGAFVRAVEPNIRPLPEEFTGDDLVGGVFIRAIYGNHGRLQDDRRDYALGMMGYGGLECWRIIHDLEPGPIALLLGPPARPGAAPLSASALSQFEQIARAGQTRLQRDGEGKLQFAVLTGNRAAYLDGLGVIDPSAFEPGDLTRSLCAPWQYDFRDCGCFYWASNKPDMVAVEPGGPQMHNFQRDRARTPLKQPVRRYAAWATGEFSYPQMILDWEALSSVVDVTESRNYELKPSVQLPSDEVLRRDEVIQRLRYLATVEHGLMVEYLYAYYSVSAPAARPTADGEEQWRYDAARIILSVAIDEMRHFRWVNEILRELDQAAELGRIDKFEDFDDDKRALEHRFSLEPLSTERLEWFIAVEQPSRSIDVDRKADSIDGLYTRLLLSVQQSSDFNEDERQRIVHLLKLIIEEGYDHYVRFQRVKALLEGLDPAAYLQLPSKPVPLPAGSNGRAYEQVADSCYGLVLSTLRYVFEMGGRKVGEMLDAARHAMYALDDAARAVTAAGGAPLFTTPAGGLIGRAVTELDFTTTLELKVAKDFEDLIAPEVTAALEPLKGVGDEALARRLRGRYEALSTALAAVEAR